MIIFKEFNDFSKLENFRESWDNFVLECKSTVYMTYDWCVTWWEFYGDKKELSICVFYDDNILIGILPIYIEKIRFGPITFKIAKLLGANLPPKVFNPPIIPRLQTIVLEHLLNNFLGGRCDGFSIGPISDKYFPDEKLERIDKSFIGGYKKELYDDYSFIELPDNFEGYLDSINKREKTAFVKNMKRLNRDNKLEIDINLHFNEKDFKDFQDLHYEQWMKRGMLGHFNSWPQANEFNTALAKRQADLGRYLLIKISKDDEPLFFGYGFIFGNVFYFQLFSRSISPENDKLSLGTIGHGIIAKHLIAQKVRTIELGPGYFDYKLNLGAKFEKVFLYKFVANRNSSRIKFSIASIEKKIRNNLYHKIWYRRVQPLLPISLKSPIQMRWISLDF